MRRTGERFTSCVVLAALSWCAAALGADPEFHQSVDRTEVGTEDTFRLTIVTPDDGELVLPRADGLAVLGRSQMTEMSYELTQAGSTIRRVRKVVLTVRAEKPGTLTIPPAELRRSGKTLKTEPVTVTVRQGSLRGGTGRPSRSPFPDPFSSFPMPGMPEELAEDFGFPNPEVPRGDSDLFLRATLDKEEVYVGEQVTMSLYAFSRVDLSSVDSVSMPKLDGFWSEDLDSPTQLAGEQRVLNGVAYRAYMLKRRALFPVKSGEFTIAPAEADITTGFMLFQGHRVHRKGNALTLKVKPLPAGAPKNMAPGNVGRFTLSMEVPTTQVTLGDPLTVRVTLEGRGNLKNVSVPSLDLPAGLKAYEPTVTDKASTVRAQLGGRRTMEFLVMPQQAGEFTLPPLSFSFFNPDSAKYETATTSSVTVTVRPSASGEQRLSGAGAPARVDGAKNKLEANGLRGLRHAARFSARGEPVYRKAFFVPVAAFPVAAWAGLALVGFVRRQLAREDPAAKKRKQAKAARARLNRAEALKDSGQPTEFYGEVEKALLHFLEAKLGTPVGGLTRAQLESRLKDAGVADDRTHRVLSALETCDAGRFAPGAAEATARDRALDDAAHAMEGWSAR